MNRWNRILRHPAFCDALRRVEQLEEERLYCCHGLPHLLDVARIAYIETMERGLPYPKDVVYAAGLLHDIGKYRQYEDGTPHSEAGARLAEQILFDTEYNEAERAMVAGAIRCHRDLPEGADDFGALLYRADKASRLCFICGARMSCNWREERKNRTLRA